MGGDHVVPMNQELRIEDQIEKQIGVIPEPVRIYLPDERKSITHKFIVKTGIEGEDDIDVYFTVGFFDNGKIGEMFIRLGKIGDELHGVYDLLMVMTSMGLQYGIPFYKVIEKFKGCQFLPSGTTNNPEIRMAKSIADYIGRWLEMRFPEGKLK